MPIDLRDLFAQTRDLTVPVDGIGEIALTYRPHVITPRFRAELRQATADVSAEESLSLWLEQVIAGWDLTLDGDAVTVSDGVRQLPDGLLTRLVQAITEDMSPNDDSALPSPTG